MLKIITTGFMAGVAAVAVATSALAGAGATGAKMAQQKATQQTAYDHSFRSIEGAPLPLSAYKGKVLLVVNTASKCGFTKQYDGLQKLWAAQNKNGLVVIGVPSNNFMGQEPGTEAEIKKFCSLNYGVDFPMTAKTDVVGKNAHPFYQWATASLGRSAVPGWNFHKILIGKDGKAIAAFGSRITPDDKDLTKAIAAALKG